MTKEIDYVELLKLAHEKLGSQSDMIAELEKTLKDTAIIWGGKLQELEKEREELIKEFAEAECMGDLAKITRQYGYEALKEQE
jgi:ABC-type transporter Mla maintaining outer membrane lipid asymmetry ATPase subunit MlaF